MFKIHTNIEVQPPRINQCYPIKELPEKTIYDISLSKIPSIEFPLLIDPYPEFCSIITILLS